MAKDNWCAPSKDRRKKKEEQRRADADQIRNGALPRPKPPTRMPAKQIHWDSLSRRETFEGMVLGCAPRASPQRLPANIRRAHREWHNANRKAARGERPALTEDECRPAGTVQTGIGRFATGERVDEMVSRIATSKTVEGSLRKGQKSRIQRRLRTAGGKANRGGRRSLPSAIGASDPLNSQSS